MRDHPAARCTSTLSRMQQMRLNFLYYTNRRKFCPTLYIWVSVRWAQVPNHTIARSSVFQMHSFSKSQPKWNGLYPCVINRNEPNLTSHKIWYRGSDFQSLPRPCLSEKLIDRPRCWKDLSRLDKQAQQHEVEDARTAAER